MPSEPLHIFDPRRNFQLQGFTRRAATTTIHNATETGISISGIFQAAEDFAVLGWWNAYDYFNHLRLKHLPKTDLSIALLLFAFQLGAIVYARFAPTRYFCWAPYDIQTDYAATATVNVKLLTGAEFRKAVSKERSRFRQSVTVARHRHVPAG